MDPDGKLVVVGGMLGLTSDDNSRTASNMAIDSRRHADRGWPEGSWEFWLAARRPGGSAKNPRWRRWSVSWWTKTGSKERMRGGA